MGFSSTLGSEPMVGWQWYGGLKAHGAVTALTPIIFDHPNFFRRRAVRIRCFSIRELWIGASMRAIMRSISGAGDWA
jgi:hypothetical protein